MESVEAMKVIMMWLDNNYNPKGYRHTMSEGEYNQALKALDALCSPIKEVRCLHCKVPNELVYSCMNVNCSESNHNFS